MNYYEQRKKTYKNVSCEMVTAQYDALAAAAKRHGVSKSELIRNAITAYLAAL